MQFPPFLPLSLWPFPPLLSLYLFLLPINLSSIYPFNHFSHTKWIIFCCKLLFKNSVPISRTAMPASSHLIQRLSVLGATFSKVRSGLISSRACLEEISYPPPASAAGGPAIHPFYFLRCLYWLLTVIASSTPISGLTGEEALSHFSPSLLSHSASLTGSCSSDQPAPLGLSICVLTGALDSSPPTSAAPPSSSLGSGPQHRIDTEVLLSCARRPPTLLPCWISTPS